jgi:hypothetical protein
MKMTSFDGAISNSLFMLGLNVQIRRVHFKLHRMHGPLIIKKVVQAKATTRTNEPQALISFSFA